MIRAPAEEKRIPNPLPSVFLANGDDSLVGLKIEGVRRILARMERMRMEGFVLMWPHRPLDGACRVYHRSPGDCKQAPLSFLRWAYGDAFSQRLRRARPGGSDD